jgi:hypothetical protein
VVDVVVVGVVVVVAVVLTAVVMLQNKLRCAVVSFSLCSRVQSEKAEDPAFALMNGDLPDYQLYLKNKITEPLRKVLEVGRPCR